MTPARGVDLAIFFIRSTSSEALSISTPESAYVKELFIFISPMEILKDLLIPLKSSIIRPNPVKCQKLFDKGYPDEV
jgi:hypothetical protein